MARTLVTAKTTPEALLAQAEQAVRIARRAGADDAAATVTRRRGLTFRWRDGRLEHVKEDAARGLSVALYVDGRYSTHATNDLDPSRLEGFLAEAVALTRHLEPDPYRRLPDPRLYAGRATEDLELVDPEVVDLAREVRLEWCRAVHERASEDGAVVSSTAHVHDDHAMSGRATSNGFAGTAESTAVLYGAQVTVREDDRLHEDGWSVAGTHRAGLVDPGDVGREALERALRRRGARKRASRRATMVVHPEAASMLIGRWLGALFAGAVQQKRSFLAAKRGEAVASTALTLEDDPLIPRALGSQAFDAEGLAARRRTLVEAGTLAGFYVDTYYGRKLSWEPTTGEPTNVVLRPGPKDLTALLADTGQGILVTSWLGGNANLATGDFSYGIRGHEIAGGVAAGAIAEMNVTGNYLDLLHRLVGVGNDPVPWHVCRAPTLVFEDVQFSGS